MAERGQRGASAAPPGDPRASAWERGVRFFRRDAWAVALPSLPRGRRLLYRAARMAHGTVAGFWRNRLLDRSATLTYFTALSVVPFLAFAFALLKGLGAYELLRRDALDPYLETSFGANPELMRAFERLLSFVDQTDMSRLGIAGLLFLVYSTIALLSGVEGALNAVWDVRRGRSLFRMITDYLAIAVSTPLLALVAVTLGTAARSSRVLGWVRTELALGPVIDFALRFTSFVVVVLALVALYVVMPNTKVRLRSAAAGGVFGGVLWQLVLTLHVNAQSGVANYNALYSGFAAVPIFMLWLYLSWVVVLAGAQLASAHQHDDRVRERMRTRQVDQALREAVAVQATARIAGAFLEGARPPDARRLAAELEVPVFTMLRVLGHLTRHGILARMKAAGPCPVYLLRTDPGAVRVRDVLRAMRRRSPDAPRIFPLEPRLDPGVRRLLARLDSDLEASPGNLALRELVDAVPAAHPAAGPESPAEDRPSH